MNLADALRDLRLAGVPVRHIEGHGILALYNVGPLKKVGFYEVLRQAKKARPAVRRDRSMVPLRPWPPMAEDAFR